MEFLCEEVVTHGVPPATHVCHPMCTPDEPLGNLIDDDQVEEPAPVQPVVPDLLEDSKDELEVMETPPPPKGKHNVGGIKQFFSK